MSKASRSKAKQHAEIERFSIFGNEERLSPLALHIDFSKAARAVSQPERGRDPECDDLGTRVIIDATGGWASFVVGADSFLVVGRVVVGGIQGVFSTS